VGDVGDVGEEEELADDAVGVLAVNGVWGGELRDPDDDAPSNH